MRVLKMVKNGLNSSFAISGVVLERIFVLRALGASQILLLILCKLLLLLGIVVYENARNSSLRGFGHISLASYFKNFFDEILKIRLKEWEATREDKVDIKYIPYFGNFHFLPIHSCLKYKGFQSDKLEF